MAPTRSPCLGPSDYVYFLREQMVRNSSNNGTSDEEDDTDNDGHHRQSSQNGGHRSMDRNGQRINGQVNNGHHHQLDCPDDLPKLSELLRNLSDDLKSGPSGFVDDFIYEPNNGISILMDILRSSLNQQQCPGMVFSQSKEQMSLSMSMSKGQRQDGKNKSNLNTNKKPSNAGNGGNKLMKTKERQFALKRAMTDEYYCLCSLQFAAQRNPQSFTRMIVHKNGLSTVASCIVSNLTKSRMVAIQILISASNFEPDGASKVLEALSVMRIVFGESVRFKLLTSVLMNGSISRLETPALKLINNIISKAPSVAEQIRFQCEFQESGFDVKQLEKKMKSMEMDPLWSMELSRWKELFVDINKVHREKRKLSHLNCDLKLEVDSLKKTLSKIEEEKLKMIHTEREMREKIEELEQEVKYLRKEKNNCQQQNQRLVKSSVTINGSNGNHNNNYNAGVRSKYGNHDKKKRCGPSSDGSSSSDTHLTTIGTADSGRWSDNSVNSSGGGNAIKSLLNHDLNMTINGKDDEPDYSDDGQQNSFEQQQDVEEDVLIYAPMKTMAPKEDRNISTPSVDDIIKIPNSKMFIKNPIYNKKSDKKCSTLDPLDSRWRLRQRRLSASSLSDEHRDVHSVHSNPIESMSAFEAEKGGKKLVPTPRKSKSVATLLDADETRRDVNVKKMEVGNEKKSVVKKVSMPKSKSTSKISIKSSSLNQFSRETLSSDELDYFSWVHPLEQEVRLDRPLNVDRSRTEDEGMVINGNRNQNLVFKKSEENGNFYPEKSQFLLKEKNVSSLINNSLVNEIHCGDKDRDNSASGMQKVVDLKKKSSSVRSCLQSFIFSGSGSSKSYDCKSLSAKSASKKLEVIPQFIGNQDDAKDNPVKIISTKKGMGTINSIFPMTATNKSSFINRGHANCGLFTGTDAGKDCTSDKEASPSRRTFSTAPKGNLISVGGGSKNGNNLSGRPSIKDIGAWL